MKGWLKILIVLVLPTLAKAQSGLTLYSLGEAVPQNANFNPALVPAGSMFLGLPGISEIGGSVNNKFSYNQAFEQSGDDTTRVDIESILSSLRKKNNLLAETRIPVLFLGIRPEGTSHTFSFFVNERVDLRAQYQQALIETLWEGTDLLVGESVNLKKSAITSTYYREYGVGLKTDVTNEIKAGARVKLVQGIANVKTMAGFRAGIDLEPLTYAYGFDFANAGIRTSGREDFSSVPYLISNKNRGFAIDAGVVYERNKLLSFAAAINDLGFIHWKEGQESFVLNDTTFVFDGVNMRTTGDVTTAIDSLENAFTPRKEYKSYTAMLTARSVLSSSLILSPADRLTLTLVNQMLVGKVKTAVSVALNKQVSRGISVSAAIVKLPQHWPTAGGAVALRGGPVQFYMASDNLTGFLNVANMKVLDLRMGLNVLIGLRKPKNESNLPPAYRSKPSYSSKGNGVDYPTDPRLRKPGVFRRNGMYDVIPRRKVPKSWRSWTNRKKPKF